MKRGRGDSVTQRQAETIRAYNHGGHKKLPRNAQGYKKLRGKPGIIPWNAHKEQGPEGNLNFGF